LTIFIIFFFAGTQQGNSYGFGGRFCGFRLWKMNSLNIPHIFAGFVLLGRCLPAANNILYDILWVQEDKRRARILNPAEKNHGCSRD
jgi:hypothetical protein